MGWGSAVTLKIHCSQMGETARRLLTTETSARVMAGFSTAVYLVTEHGEVFWLASEKVPMHPRGMRIVGYFPKFTAGAKVVITDESILSPPGLQVDFHNVPTWAVLPASDSIALEIDKIPAKAKSIFSTCFDASQARGFGRLIPRVLSLTDGQLDDRLDTDPVLSLGWAGISKIARACLFGDTTGLLQESRALVGLGEGLTPSGDDFLCGLLFCINTIQRFYPRFINLDPFERLSFIQSVKQRTHLISYTILKDAGDGQVVQPLHDLIHAVLSDQELEIILQHMSDLTQIGHSTGWDMLTGLVTGLLLVFRGHNLIDLAPVSRNHNIYVSEGI
jgi:hypothetical protein